MSVFQKFFNKPKPQLPPLDPILPGERFPGWEAAEQNKPSHIALFVSFTCRSCIELLEQLPQLLPDYDGGMRLFILNGTQEEVREMQEYFGFSFPVKIIRSDEGESMYKVRSTPFAYGLDKDGYVMRSGWLAKAEDFAALMTEMNALTRA